MAKIFTGIYQFFKTRRLVFFSTFVACFLIAAFFASRVHFEEDISKVLPRDKTIGKLTEVFSNSRFLDKLVITVSLRDSRRVAPDSLIEFSEAFVSRLGADLQPYVASITHKVEDSLALGLFATVQDHLPLYLEPTDYPLIDSLITPAKIRETVQQNFRTLTSPAGFALKNMISDDPVGISFIAFKKLQQLQYDDNFELYDGYLLTKDERHLLLFIQPAFPPNNTGKNAALLAGIDKVFDSLHKTFPQVQGKYFGATAVSVGNALQLRRDSLLTQGVTLVFLIIFFGVYFRKRSAPFVILIPVVFGALFSLAAIYFLQGSISVIALGTGSVILGIAVNYSLHVFNHYRHTRTMEETIADLAFPLTIGSFTTVGGFLCLQFVESEMLRDLGLFAAFSLVGASLSSLIFLPHFVAVKNESSRHQATTTSWLDRFAAYRPEYNKLLVAGIFLLTIFFGFYAGRAGFESDLGRMNYMSPKLKQAEAELNAINEYALRSVYLVTDGKDLNQALVHNEQLITGISQLQIAGVIKKYSGVSSLIISDSLQRLRIQTWNSYWTRAKKAGLLATLQNEGVAAGFRPGAFDAFKTLVEKEYQPISANELNALRKNFLDDYITETNGKASVVTLVKVAAENKAQVYAAFKNNSNVTVVDKQYLAERFVAIINADFSKIALMSSIFVFLVLLVTYGRIELALVSFIPMLISWIWILGIMGLFDIKFNIINIIVSALIFGLGDDYSLFVMDGLLREYKTGRKNLSSYKSSIFLSAITTVAGLGVLIFAQHPALRSIALISIIGILSVVLMSQILIPFFFRLIIRSRIEKKGFPWTAIGFLRSVFAFIYFVSGALLVTVIGLLFSLLKPLGREGVKLAYHKVLSGFCWSLMYIMANVTKKVVNPSNEDFSRPAIIVANHQSFLDILSLVMLHPKLILFTNNWVWNSPVFGAVVRMADYYPVEQGVENSLELIADRVRHGYSVVVFPEGTRSVDRNIKRFHKGAFFLAEKLDLDILPIVLHGTGYTMTKGDFLLKNGTITLELLPRVKPQDEQFGVGYAARSKMIGRHFRQEFARASERIEQPRYFKERLVYNFLYKGPELEWYLKVKVSLEKNYQVFHDLLPKQGKLLDVGCGYGFMSYMLYFTAPAREITGIDYDEEKINTANHCFDKTGMINFYATDALDFKYEHYDGIVIADMLHYLQPAQQKMLVEKCIRHLNPGGSLIIRDGNAELQKRHRGTRLTEFFSTRMFGFNKVSAAGLSFLSATLIREIATTTGLDYQEIDQSTFTSNMIYILKKQPL
ncbi:MAG: 1-acyl-sn-glycerol-3-phosphate acyltransferase [Bacteroidota bacterium]